MKKIAVSHSDIDGHGIIAIEPISKGDMIAHISGRKVRMRSRTKEEAQSIPNWFGLSGSLWLDPAGTPFQYLNHSCEPNAAIANELKHIALRNIATGEEISVDYSMTDADSLWEMSCRCNTTSCRNTIRSIHSVPLDVYRRHGPHIPSFFKRIYEINRILKVLRLRK